MRGLLPSTIPQPVHTARRNQKPCQAKNNTDRRSPVKAYVVDKYKKKGALRLAELPDPQVHNADVLVRVHATAVNVLDSKVRDGEFKIFLPYRPPFVLGHDVAGTVVKVGPGVSRFKVGDEIY